MAYRHYETEGLIIGYHNLGEANRLYQVLTRDFGLVNILAQGVRRDRSKLRHHLKNFSFTHLVLVRGREFWRVVGVDDLDLSSLGASKIALPFLKKISLVLQRLIHGEEANPFIYQDLKQAWVLIIGQARPVEEGLVDLEVFILVRLLTQLGYLAPLAGLAELVSSPAFSWVEVKNLGRERLSLIKKINQALELTQL